MHSHEKNCMFFINVFLYVIKVITVFPAIILHTIVVKTFHYAFWSTTSGGTETWIPVVCARWIDIPIFQRNNNILLLMEMFFNLGVDLINLGVNLIACVSGNVNMHSVSQTFGLWLCTHTRPPNITSCVVSLHINYDLLFHLEYQINSWKSVRGRIWHNKWIGWGQTPL